MSIALPAAPILTQAWEVPATVSTGVCPFSARTKKGLAVARQTSMIRTGRLPPPAMMPSLGCIFKAGLANAPRGVGADEIDDFHDALVVRKHGNHVFKPLGHGSLVREQQPVGVAQGMDFIAGKVPALEPNDVEAIQARAVADDTAERNNVVFDARHPTDHGMAANARELVSCGQPADNGPVTDLDVAAKSRTIHQDDMIANKAVMSDMGT